MRSRVTRLASRSLTVAAVVASLMLVVPVLLQGATIWVVSFTIDDGFANAKVRSDLGIAYPDYRLADVEGDHNCIEAAPTTTGLHAVLNRKIDADGTRCNPAGSDRQYHIRLTAAPEACQKLIAAYGSGVVPSDLGDGCELLWTANPRVRVGDLFKRGSASTPPGVPAGQERRQRPELRDQGPYQRPDVGAHAEPASPDLRRPGDAVRVRQRQGEVRGRGVRPRSPHGVRPLRGYAVAAGRCGKCTGHPRRAELR